MNNDLTTIEVDSVTNNGRDASYFSKATYELQGEQARMLSSRVNAENFRLRRSDSSYSSDWHVAGDPTLLIVLQGSLKITLRNGSAKQFNQGQMFIAEDYLATGIEFDKALHGHRAQVIGEQECLAIHLKLSYRHFQEP